MSAKKARSRSRGDVSKGKRAPSRPRKRSAAPWLVGAAALLGVAALASTGGPSHSVAREGAPAPELSVKTLDHERVKLTDLRGKVVLVNFWATWCPPCRAEMPGFEAVWRERGRDGFVALGLSADDGPGAVENFLNERGITYRVAMATPSTKAAFGGANSLPQSFLIDRHGIVRRIVFGEYNERRLRQDVTRLLRER